MNNKYLEIEDLSVKYGDFLALNQVSWSEYSSGIVGLIGNNGAGKTTLIKSILGLISSQSKKLFKGVAQAQISYCPDKPLFEPWLTPQEVLEQAIFLTYLQDSSVRRASLHSIPDFLNEVDLFKHKDKKVGGFSRGMMQRLGIAVSLVTHPKMLFLDEPTSALDPLGIQEIESLIKEYSKNALIVYSTHNLDQLERISDKVFLLDKGKNFFTVI